MLTLRKWQKNCLRVLQDGVSNNKKTFSVVACPGSGKTVLQAAFASYLINQGLVDCVINIVPSDTLRSGNAEVFDSLFGLTLSTAKPGLEDAPFGFSTTYQMITRKGNVNALLKYTIDKGKRFALIADEVHHGSTSDLSQFGSGLGHLMAAASYTLLLSGTLWRTDGHQIAGVTYREQTDATKSVAEPDFTYSLSDATNDDVVAPVFFTELSAAVAVQNSKTTYEHYAVVKYNPHKTAVDPYKHVINPEGTFCSELLEQAVDALDSKRTDHTASSTSVIPPAGLVIASTKDAAGKISKLLQSLTGESPVVVHGDIPDSKNLIKQFKDGDLPNKWMVAVGMVSEGVDIPRVKVIAYLTSSRTELLFHQIVGRAMRVRRKECGSVLKEDAQVFLPASPDLHTYVSRFTSHQHRVISIKEKSKVSNITEGQVLRRERKKTPKRFLEARVIAVEVFLNGVRQSFDNLLQRLDGLLRRAELLLSNNNTITL